MVASVIRKMLFTSVFMTTLVLSSGVTAGGIVLGGTRIIYHAGDKQATISVRNTSTESRYLLQSWFEDAQGKKSNDLIVTPPLFVSNSGNENSLRIIYTGPTLPADKETLYYFNAKAIPAVDKKENENRNVLMLAAVTRIKVFIRPTGLKTSFEEAPSQLTFEREGRKLKITNPTPYYLTLIKMTSGSAKIKDTMIPPKGSVSIDTSLGTASSLNYSIINDYGATSKQFSKPVTGI